ncbi:inorganic carbon transporter [Stanieria cyanosphaera PCC 7437]|uniref:Inorganic carbon transporter n=1 Tax=Stanieria cyanosphaera (strain ATCC 29371 / PCC 7437) TaxID=111780 RepID=K9XYW8_STAC7|nr:IctB family putative bicarbonate transporter [Stanieria cyanosphaera]AFZ37224.1 inorganic carbon transporter [Stanieria cyanosphaera PCC 7437]
MKSAWTKIVLSDLSLYQWHSTSYLYRFIGWFSSWRQGSWLLQWGEALGAALLSVLFVLAPFVSTSLLGLLLVALAGYWIIFTISEEQQLEVTPIHLVVLVYWCIATVATAFSPVKAEALSGWMILTLYLVMFALAARVLRSPRICNGVITVFLLVALWVSTYGVRQQVFGVAQLATWNDPNSPLAQDTRVYSYLGNPNLLGGYLLPAIALSIGAVLIWRGWLQKILAFMMVGVNSACLYFTDSRGAWLAMLALMTVLLLLLYYWWRDYLPRFWQVWLLPLVFGTLAGLIIAAIVLVEPLRLRFLSIFAGREDSSNNFRINVWEAVFKMIRDYPLTGIGPGHEAFNKVYPRYMNSRYPALSAYSVFLEHLVEMGYLGLICFIWLIVVTIDSGIRQIERFKLSSNRQGLWLISAIAAIAGLSVHGLVDTVWYRPQISTLWWLMLAIVASQIRRFPVKQANTEFSQAKLSQEQF